MEFWHLLSPATYNQSFHFLFPHYIEEVFMINWIIFNEKSQNHPPGGECALAPIAGSLWPNTNESNQPPTREIELRLPTFQIGMSFYSISFRNVGGQGKGANKAQNSWSHHWIERTRNYGLVNYPGSGFAFM